MAYDEYRTSSSPYDQMGNNNMNPTGPNNNDINNDPRPLSYQPPYPPSQYAPDQIDMTQQPQMPPPYPSSGLNPESYQNTTMPVPVPVPPQQPRPQGGNDAFYKPDTSSSSYVSPDLIAQITANVIQQLRVSGFDGLQGGSQQQQQRQQQQQQWTPTASTAPGSTYTYPEPPPRPASQNTASILSPRPVTENVNYQQPPPTQTDYPNILRPSPKPSPGPPPPERPASSSTQRSHKDKETRPAPPSRAATELTTLEKIWGKLFEDGKPTARLGQFLRGIAVHLIENYPPGNKIVVVPDKMQKFYHDTNIPSDPYPWQDIFDDQTSSISRLYRQVKAEHHLVQEDLSERPDIPGLTPRGFERWMTLMILAHPEKEYERLAKAVLDMPISNPDDRKERFPKEIPRRLFPDKPDLKLREELDEFIMAHCAVDLPVITNEERAMAAATAAASGSSTSSAKPAKSAASSFEEPVSFGEQGRKKYSATVEDEVEGEAEAEATPAHPIERQRKPYTAQPGGGKVYGEPGTPRHGRADSFSTATRPDEISLLSPSSHHSDHYNSHDPLYPPAGSGPGAVPHLRKRGHSRSSSFNARGDYRHSESDLLSHGTTSRYEFDPRYPNSSSSALPGDIIDDGTGSRRYRDSSERGREDARLHDLLREREREREKSRHRHEHHPHAITRSSWSGDEEFYRGMLGGQGGSPAGSGSGYDYKTYTYR